MARSYAEQGAAAGATADAYGSYWNPDGTSFAQNDESVQYDADQRAAQANQTQANRAQIMGQTPSQFNSQFGYQPATASDYNGSGGNTTTAPSAWGGLNFAGNVSHAGAMNPNQATQFGTRPMSMGAAGGDQFGTKPMSMGAGSNLGFGGDQFSTKPYDMGGGSGQFGTKPYDMSGGGGQFGTKPMNMGGMGNGMGSGGSSNPYMDGMADDITRRVNNNYQNNIMPGINGSAIAAGQFGGSRQGVAQGLAAGQTSDALAGQLANLYGQDNQFSRTLNQNNSQFGRNLDQNNSQFGRNLDQNNSQFGRSLDQNNSQFGRNNELQANTAGQNFYTNNRGQDLQQMQIGSSLFGAGVNGQAALGSGMYGVGNQFQSAPMDWANKYGNTLNQFTGLGGSTVTTGPQGSRFQQGLGGAMAGAQLGQNLWNQFGGGTQSQTTNYGSGWQGTQGGQFNNPSAM